MTTDTFLVVAFSVMIVLFVVMIGFGIPRGKRMQKTNEQIEANQRRQMEMSERNTKAVERIADALEDHARKSDAS